MSQLDVDQDDQDDREGEKEPEPREATDDPKGIARSEDERIPVRVRNLCKAFETDEGVLKAVDNVSFDIEPGRFYTLLGPSGCGKSTTLRCIAGLESADSGRIDIGERTVVNDSPRVFVPAHDRRIGMVFQSYAIWPHMSVGENVAFPLRARNEGGGRGRRLSRKAIAQRVSEALEEVQLGGFEKRPATKLSGGQQQRLALARALVSRPRLLLLDEPLSNLDASLREEMRVELRNVQRNTGVTTLYVTHDQQEALSMSNRVAVMRQGRIVQEGRPREVYSQPATKFVATFVGKTNLFEGKLVESEPGGSVGGEAALDTAAGRIWVGVAQGLEERSGGTAQSVVVRPEDVALHEDDPADGRPNVLPGQVTRSTFLGETLEVEVQVGDTPVVVHLHPSLKFRRGDDVFMELPVDRCVAVPEDVDDDAVADGDEHTASETGEELAESVAHVAQE